MLFSEFYYVVNNNEIMKQGNKNIDLGDMVPYKIPLWNANRKAIE